MDTGNMERALQRCDALAQRLEKVLSGQAKATERQESRLVAIEARLATVQEQAERLTGLVDDAAALRTAFERAVAGVSDVCKDVRREMEATRQVAREAHHVARDYRNTHGAAMETADYLSSARKYAQQVGLRYADMADGLTRCVRLVALMEDALHPERQAAGVDGDTAARGAAEAFLSGGRNGQ